MRVNIKNLFALAGVSLLAACAPQYYGGPADYTPVPSQGNAAPVSPQNDAAPPIALVPPPSYYPQQHDYNQQQPDYNQQPPSYYQQQPPPGYYQQLPGYYPQPYGYGYQGGYPRLPSYTVPYGAWRPDVGKYCKSVMGCKVDQN